MSPSTSKSKTAVVLTALSVLSNEASATTTGAPITTAAPPVRDVYDSGGIVALNDTIIGARIEAPTTGVLTKNSELIGPNSSNPTDEIGRTGVIVNNGGKIVVYKDGSATGGIYEDKWWRE